MQSWNEQIDLRTAPGEQATERKTAETEVKVLTAEPVDVQPPAKFRNLPPLDVTTLGTSGMRLFAGQTKILPDATLESGTTARFEIPDAEIEKYKLPMPWGVMEWIPYCL